MSVKEIKAAMEELRVFFGIRQTLKNVKNLENVFIAKDVRDETVKVLEDAGIEFSVLKPKSEMAKELNLGFESEVFSIKKESRKK